MNLNYRIIWNASINTYQVASELTKANGKSLSSSVVARVKSKSRSVARFTYTLVAASLLAILTPQLAIAADYYSVNDGGVAQPNKVGDGATGSNSLAIGTRSTAAGNTAVAIGNLTKAIGANTFVAGNQAHAGANGAVAIGLRANAENATTPKQTGGNSVAIGTDTHAGAAHAVAIGTGAKTDTSGIGSVSVGAGSSATGVNAAAVGQAAEALGQNAFAAGNDSHATGKSAVAVGDGAGKNGSGDSSTSVGTLSASAGPGSTAVGLNSNASDYRSTALGAFSEASGMSSFAGGDGSKAGGLNSIAVGKNSQASGVSEIAIGNNAMKGATTGGAERNIAIGENALSNSNAEGNNIAIGTSSGQGINGLQSIMIGVNVNTETVGMPSGERINNVVAIGTHTLASKQEAIAFGYKTQATAVAAVAIGSSSKATVANGVALGKGSVADVDLGKVGSDPLSAATDKSGATWTATSAAVSVGDFANGITRQITSVAAGTEDTDAVNVAQLKAAGFTLNATASDGEATSIADDKIQNGETLTVDAGKNIKVTHTANKVSIATKDEVEFNSVTVPTDPTDPNAPKIVINNKGIDMDGKPITNLTTTIADPTTATDVAKPNNLTTTNAATLGDVLNTGWNIQGNGSAVDFVQPYDTVNFVDGNGTVAKVETTDNKTTTVKYDVNVDDDTIKIVNGKLQANVQGNTAATTWKVNTEASPEAKSVSNQTVTVNHGINTKVSEVKQDAAGNYSYEIDVTGLPMEYVDKDGKPLVNVGGKFYTQEDNGAGGLTLTPAEPAKVRISSDKPMQLTNVDKGEVSATSTDAVNGSQLYATNQNVANNTTNIAKNAAEIEKGLDFAGDVGEFNRKLGQKTTIKGGITDESKLSNNNIGVIAKGNTLEVKLAKDIKVDSVVAGNTTVNNSGVTIAAANPENNVSLTSSGLNNGGNRIINVAPGVNDTDAVNVAQLKGITNNINNLHNHTHKVDRNARAGIAGALATGDLPQPYLPSKSMIAVGVGSYRGETAIALGASKNSDNGKWIIKGSANMDSRRHVGVSGSIGYQF